MATMTMTMVWAIILFWCAMMGVVVRGSAEAERLTSTVCPSLRWGTYPAQLDLYYFYLIEFNNATTPDLQGIERAIAVRLVDMLEYKGCNVYGEPVIAMELNEKGHRYSSGGESSPQCMSRLALVFLLGYDMSVLERLTLFSLFDSICINRDLLLCDSTR